MGAHGGIGTFYNLVPELLVGIWNLSREGKWDEVMSIQTRINGLVRLLLAYPMLPAVKQVLDWRGIPAGPCIGPRQKLSPEQKLALREGLTHAGFAEWVAAVPSES
jgi:dihydrodipicolinate synthase/N-acetylneuraminate lyase